MLDVTTFEFVMRQVHTTVHASIFGAIVTYFGVYVTVPQNSTEFPAHHDVNVHWDVPYLNVSAHEKHKLDIYQPIDRIRTDDISYEGCNEENGESRVFSLSK